ncbi:MAG TPA: hypothetical protein VHZ76_00770 [Gammaproteobacteria bacterium]|jgi:hypothetical protein|nr:hypothetical protein [Gammaproteobacteria bacterium]
MRNHLTSLMRQELQWAIVNYGSARGICDYSPSTTAHQTVLDKWRVIEKQLDIIFAECNLVDEEIYA